MQTKITQVDILHRVPKLRKNTYWKKLSNGEYYITNTDFSSPLFVSEYVIEFLRLATGESTLMQICEKAGLCVDESNISEIYELYYSILYPTGVLETEEIEIKKKKSYINLSFTILPGV